MTSRVTHHKKNEKRKVKNTEKKKFKTLHIFLTKKFNFQPQFYDARERPNERDNTTTTGTRLPVKHKV